MLVSLFVGLVWDVFCLRVPLWCGLCCVVVVGWCCGWLVGWWWSVSYSHLTLVANRAVGVSVGCCACYLDF